MRERERAGPQELTPQQRRRIAVVSFLTSAFVSITLLVGYFVLPFTSPVAVDTLLELFLGLVVVSGLLVWQVRAILASPVPAVRAIGALMVSVPLFLILFATAYFLMARDSTTSFNEPLSRLDALYFTITVLATVGFGDIVAVSETTRAVVTVQMVGDLILVGLIARVILGAVERSRTRKGGRPPPRP